MSDTSHNIINNIKNSYIAVSHINGYGLFALQDISPNTILGKLDGQEVSYELYNNNRLSCEWHAVKNSKIIVRPYKTKYFYINHCREPNLKLMHDTHQIVTLKAIKENEEYTLDYREQPLPLDYVSTKGEYL